MENQIKLVQEPVIKYDVLIKIGQEVTSRIKSLNLENQVATAETVKTLKEMRADLNKELTEFEAQRKAIKEGVNNPYIEFEQAYKVEISEKYKAGIDTLKDKIAVFEDQVKLDKSKAVESYFTELCISEGIDFIKFDSLNLDINLSTSEKKYKEQINEFIAKVQDDLALIKTTDYQAEILAEYKGTLNVSQAIVSVKARKEAEEKEAALLKAEKIKCRIDALINLGFSFEEMTKSYELKDMFYISNDEIENFPDSNFSNFLAKVQVQIAAIKKQEQAENSVTAPVTGPVIPVQAPTIKAPTQTNQVADEPIKRAVFEVHATMSKLKALGAFMRENNIEFKNL